MAELAAGSEDRIKILAGLIGLSVLASALALALATQNIGLATLLIAAIGFVVVFPFPKLAVVIVVLFAQIQYLFTGFYGTLISHPVFPVSFQWLDDIVLLALFFNLLLTKLLKGKDQPLEKAPGLIPLALLFLVGLMSARLNGVPLVAGLLGQRYVFEMVVLYLAIINLDFNERFLRGLIYLLLAIGVFQAGVGLLEFVRKYPLYAAGNHDIVQGTWGGGSANNLGLFFLFLSSIVLSRMRRGWRGRNAVLLGIYVILLVLTSSRTAIVLLPFVFLFILRDQLKDPKYWIVAAAGFAFMAGALVFYYRNMETEVGKDLGAGEFSFQIMGRTGVIPIMGNVLHANSNFPLFGAGPSTYLTELGRRRSSDLYMQVEALARTREVAQAFIQASYAVIWMEYGLVGLVLFGAVLWRLFHFAWRHEKKMKTPFWQDYFRALQAIIIVNALAGGIFPLWTHFQMNVYLWLFPAIGVRCVVLQRRTETQAARTVGLEEESTGDRLSILPRLRHVTADR